MIKLITHAAVFLIGAGAGVYWGVHNPTTAANLSEIESAKVHQAVAQAKQDVLQKVVADQSAPTNAGKPTPHLGEYQQMLQSSQQDLSAAKAKLNGQ
jgi:hypothetical protein